MAVQLQWGVESKDESGVGALEGESAVQCTREPSAREPSANETVFNGPWV